MTTDRRSFLKLTTFAAGSLAVGASPLAAASHFLRGLPSEDRERMRAILVREYGPPGVLRMEEVPRPRPGAGELLVRVHAAGVNPVDAIARRGQWDIAPPFVPGFDLSGVVVAVGRGVNDFRVGDEVFALLDLKRAGAYAEYAVVKADEAARKPRGASHAEAASIPLVGLTSWQALFETADLEAGQSVLIHAGAGGVGSIAIQLAKWKGATVYATASEPNHAYMRELGADVAIDYRTQRFEEIARNVDVVLDPIADETQVRSLAVLKAGGILVSLNGLTGAARSSARNVRARAILVRPHPGQLRQIAGLMEDGTVKPMVSHLLPLEQAPEAHVQSESGRTRGKIVLEVVPEP
jgi:NADPH:quinone reductase-like Zn-dependent oxidoreductase